jgi:hypothetical protein
MDKKTCHWYISVSGDAERLAHFCATLSSTTIFSEQESKNPNASAFCCGKRVTRPAKHWFGDGLSREEHRTPRTPLSAMARI